MNTAPIMRAVAFAMVVMVVMGDSVDVTRAYSCQRRGEVEHVAERGGPVKCAIEACTNAISAHVQKELEASFDYLYLAAHFDDVREARPGLAKFLYESASEEREHAIMMLAYLDRRGVPVSANHIFEPAVNNLKDVFNPSKAASYGDVLDFALTREMEVTRLILGVIKKCENDYDAADFFTQPIVAEQFEGMRKLRGAISSFADLSVGSSPDLAEFIFDRRLLKNGL